MEWRLWSAAKSPHNLVKVWKVTCWSEMGDVKEVENSSPGRVMRAHSLVDTRRGRGRFKRCSLGAREERENREKCVCGMCVCV